MKKLLIGLGGCGNNIINLIQDQLDQSCKTLSIQKDLQLLSISQADFTLNPKDKDYEEKFKVILEHASEVKLILGSSGTTSLLYLEKILKYFNDQNIPFEILAIEPNKYEGSNKLEISKKVITVIKENTNSYQLIKNDDLNDTDYIVVNTLTTKNLT